MVQPDKPSVDFDPEGKTAEDVAQAPAGGGLGSLADDLKDLAEDAQTALEAEMAYQSARAAYVWNGTRGAVVWLALAFAAAFFALMALVVGLLLALIPLLGVWAALGSVAVGLLLVAFVAIRIALTKFARVRSQAVARDPVVPPKGVRPPEPLGPPTPPELKP